MSEDNKQTINYGQKYYTRKYNNNNNNGIKH